MYPYTGIAFIVGCVVAYKLLKRLYWWNDDQIKRRAAKRKGIQLVEAMRLARADAARRAATEQSFPTWPKPAAEQPYRNPITGTAGEWDHIPGISYDLSIQEEFGGSRYHTVYISPEQAADRNETWGGDTQPGLYITDKREGPELIGAPTKKRWFIPHDQLIMRPCSVCGNELESGVRFCGQCGAQVRTEPHF